MNVAVWQRFSQAFSVAEKGEEDRNFFVGAVGIRDDGTIVKSHNKKSKDVDRRLHAEFRLSKKLDVGSVVYVARATRGGNIGCAAPCMSCRNAMKKRGVKRVYYTNSGDDYDWIDL